MRTLSFPGLFHLALLAAVVCTLGDAVHVYTATLRYPEPLWFGQAGWVFPLFFTAFLLTAFGTGLLVKHLPAAVTGCYSQAGGRWSELVDQLLLFFLIYLLSGFGNYSPDLLLTIFTLTFFFRLAFSPQRVLLLLLALMLVPGGMIAEGLLGQLGLVAYREPEWFNVPLWLGGLYAHGAFALREGVRVLVLKRVQVATLV